MTKKYNNEKLANKIYKRACTELNKSLANFPLDKEMVNLYLSDFSDTLKVAIFIRDEKVKKAFALATGMDTAAREKIHEDFWALYEAYED